MTRINVTAEEVFPVICAWCKEVVGYSIIRDSHSICRECSKRLLEEYDSQAREE